MRAFLLAVTLLGVAAPSRRPTIPPKADALVKPVVDALCKLKKAGWSRDREWRLGRLLGDVLGDRSAAGDEAVVLLLDYRLDAGFAFDLLDNISIRGEREMPYLRKYEGQPTWGLIASQECLPLVRARPETRARNYNELKAAIKRHQRLGVS